IETEVTFDLHVGSPNPFDPTTEWVTGIDDLSIDKSGNVYWLEHRYFTALRNTTLGPTNPQAVDFPSANLPVPHFNSESVLLRKAKKGTTTITDVVTFNITFGGGVTQSAIRPIYAPRWIIDPELQVFAGEMQLERSGTTFTQTGGVQINGTVT